MSRVYLEYLGDGVELPVGETLIGRDVGCALRFNDPAVSRRHVRFIRRQDDEVFAEDVGSSNGTMVNGSLISEPARLVDGDTVYVGSRLITIRVVDADTSAASTLVLKNFTTAEDIRKITRAATTQMATTVPPPLGSQRPALGEPKVNRRRHDRTSVEIRLVYVSSELEIEATTRDLSVSGVFVCSQVLDPVGTVCDLTFLLDGGPPLQVRGIVRRVVEHDQVGAESVGIGVELVDVGRDQRAWINAVVARDATASADQSSM